MTMRPLGQLFLRKVRQNQAQTRSVYIQIVPSRVAWPDLPGHFKERTHRFHHMMHSLSTDLGELKVGKRERVFMGCCNVQNSHVLCVSDTTLSAASMRAQISKK
jgi:hypothetical protein